MRASLGGPYIYWDELDQKVEDVIEDRREFVLKENSIASDLG
jgi:hypothetical protein